MQIMEIKLTKNGKEKNESNKKIKVKKVQKLGFSRIGIKKFELGQSRKQW